MPEIRFELLDEDMAVLDGYCSATSTPRTEIIKNLISEWAERQLHVATVILRVAGRNPTGPESDRSHTGVPPKHQ